jgi:hypothetical protein
MIGTKAGLVTNLWLLAVLFLLWPTSANAKVQVDFDPGIDFSKYKTFAYLGGVEKLVMLQLNPDLINNRVHRAVTRELTAKGLREVKPDENPDLVVRYWANSSTEINVSAMTNFGPYGAYIGSYWGFMYDTVTATSQRTGSLLLDVIDPRKKDLVWRLYIIRKINNVDKAWKQVNEDFTEGFESYPPSQKEIEAKIKERSEHKPKAEPSQ